MTITFAQLVGPPLSGQLGGVKEGSGLSIEVDGTINLDVATTSLVGGVKPDGSTITVQPDGTITAISGSISTLQQVTDAGSITTRRITSGGLTSNSTFLSSSGSLSSPGISFLLDPDTGFFLSGSGLLSISYNNTLKAEIGSNCNFYSGVSVSSLVASGLNYPTTDGTSGQVLTTDGSGTLSWTTAGGGTVGTLQTVTDNGATTTNNITVQSSANPTGENVVVYPNLINVLNGRIQVQTGGQPGINIDGVGTPYINVFGGGYISLGTGTTSYTEKILLSGSTGQGSFASLVAAGLTYPTSDGTSGQVLTTDGAGTLGWSSAGSSTGYANVKDFGALGNGIADDTAAINAAIASTTGVVFFPPGDYRVSSGITIGKKIKLQGSGFGSQITYTGTGTLLTLQYANSNQIGPQYEIDSLSLFNWITPSDCCIELQYTGLAQIVGGDDKLHLTNVLIHTYSYWRKALFLNRSGGVYIVNSSFINNNNGTAETTPGVYGIHVLNDLAGHNIIRAVHAVNFYIQRFYRCIYVECLAAANAVESIYVANTELLGDYGVYLEGEIGAVSFVNTHFDTITQAFYAPETSVIRVCGCDIRCGRNNVLSSPIIQVGNSANNMGQQTTWVGNNVIGLNTVMMSIDGCAGHIVQGNNFLGGSSNTGIRVRNNAFGVTVSGNNIFNTATEIINTSTEPDVNIGQTGSYTVGTSTIQLANGIVTGIT